MITVHHLKQSRSTRILWLLEELNLPYTVIEYDRDPVTHLAPPALLAIHPLGKSPTVDIDGTLLVESAAIGQFILDRYAPEKLQPSKASPQYAQYLQWLHFAEGSAALPVLLHMFTDKIEGIQEAPVYHYTQKEIRLDFGYIEHTLSESSYFAGEHFTLADIMMTSMLLFADKQGLLAERPATLRFLSTMQARTALQKAMAFG